MNVTLLSYATPEYSRAQNLLHRSARWFGIKKHIKRSDSNLKSTDFYRQWRPILDQPRGAGYWLWKPYFILETLKSLPENEVLMYCDAGMFFRKDVQPLLNLTQESDCVFFYNDIRCSHYVKRDVFLALNCDSQEYYDAPMIHANLQLYRKTPSAIQFLEEVMHFCTFDELITDSPNKSGQPNLDGFIENRHDQAIFSLLAHKHRKTVYVDPSQFIVRNAKFERGKGDISVSPLPYNRIVYMHRYRNNQINKLYTDVLKKMFRL